MWRIGVAGCLLLVRGPWIGRSHRLLPTMAFTPWLLLRDHRCFVIYGLKRSWLLTVRTLRDDAYVVIMA